ncbi:MAG: homocysteine S-methyltransferase family protein [Anaerovoracaceae bacterium]
MKINELFGDGFVFLDGAFGTMLQKKGRAAGDVPEAAVITNPDVVRSIHADYIDAGADAVYACTFGANRYKLAGTGYSVDEIVGKAVAAARGAADASGRTVRVALDIGPLGRLLEPNGDLSFEDAYDAFAEIVRAGKNADFIVIETMTDLYEARAALIAAKENSDLPVICTMSFEKSGRTFTGAAPEACALTLESLGAEAVGVNCSLGPDDFGAILERMAEVADVPLIAKPNAGMPDPETGEYPVDSGDFAEKTAALTKYGVKFLGGCCGTDPEYIRKLRQAAEKYEYIKPAGSRAGKICTADKVIDFSRPRVAGERLNPTGKKKLKEALKTGDMAHVLSVALKEAEEGADVLDVNVGVPGIDEKSTMRGIVKTLQGRVDLPLQIDSEDPEVIDAALRLHCGRTIVNSVSGKEGSLEKILPVAAKYGAAVVGLALDDGGIPQTAEKRLEIAEKIVKRAESYGIDRQDIFIDCLTLTVSADQKNARETLRAIKMVKQELGVNTVLGVSNISFGLPARPVINSYFLEMALTQGLDLAIMDPGSEQMRMAIDTYDLIMGIDEGAREFIPKYKDYAADDRRKEKAAPGAAGEKQADSTAAGEKNKKAGNGDFERAKYLIENGMDRDTEKFAESMLEKMEPLDVVNKLLIPVLDDVGDRFARGEIFIPQLILAANTAKSAFSVIQKNIASSGGAGESADVVVTATVKGDIHDIGKNIACVIMENYGFKVDDLGKDVDPEMIVAEVKKTHARLVGVSALMTTSLPGMEETIRLLRKEVPDCRIMAGGAVLTEEYAKKIGADFYVKDASASAEAARKVYGR